MKGISLLCLHNADMDDILEPNEQLLWSGFPAYGRQFKEMVGDERVTHISLLVGTVFMWASLLLIAPASDTHLGRADAVLAFGFATLAFCGFSVFLASKRQYILSNLFYMVTDKRAIVCRRGGNWRMSVRLYVASCPHSPTYPYSIVRSRPYPSLRIGTLLSVDQQQPFGNGLSHPGHSILIHRNDSPVTFDYVPNADELLDLILENTR